MAANVVNYVDVLLRRQISAVDRLGAQVMAVDRQLYAVDLSLLVLVGVVIKALNDHNIVLDAEWQTRLDAALQGVWPDWIVNQVDPTRPVG